MTKHLNDDPRTRYRKGGTEDEEQSQPGLTTETDPKPDHGEDTYVGSGRLAGMRALITGGDSGIGRAVAIAYAREGADVAIVHLPEEADDAASTAALIEDAGRTALALPGDVRDEDFCADAVTRTADELGGLDILVLNAAYQKNRDGIESFETEEFDRVFRTNIYSMFWFARAAVPLMKPGSSVITTASIQAVQPSPNLLDYAMTKAAQVDFTQGTRAGARREGHPRERRRAGTDLDAAHSRDGIRRHVGVRAGHPDRPRGPACGARSRVRDARLARGVVHLGGRGARDGRQTVLTRGQLALGFGELRYGLVDRELHGDRGDRERDGRDAGGDASDPGGASLHHRFILLSRRIRAAVSRESINSN